MLPDFPKTKQELLRVVLRRITQIEKEQHPVLARIRTYTQHEGKSIDFEQVDFGRHTQEAEHCEVEVSIGVEEIPTLVGAALDAKLRAVAEQSGAHKMKLLFCRIEEATVQTGQIVNAGGKPLDARMLLDMLDMGQTGFDSSGKPTSSFLVHPSLIPALRQASEEVERDPELKRRLESINRKHRQQWIDSENRRKLVD